MSQTDITKAAFDHLLEFVYSPQPQIVWPGIDSAPPATGIWLEPTVFHDEPDDIAWDNDGCILARGFVQINVHFRPGTGMPEPVAMADALIEHFPKTTALGTVRVVYRGWQAPPVTEDHDLYIPVTIPFLGLT